MLIIASWILQPGQTRLGVFAVRGCKDVRSKYWTNGVRIQVFYAHTSRLWFGLALQDGCVLAMCSRSTVWDSAKECYKYLTTTKKPLFICPLKKKAINKAPKVILMKMIHLVKAEWSSLIQKYQLIQMIQHLYECQFITPWYTLEQGDTYHVPGDWPSSRLSLQI